MEQHTYKQMSSSPEKETSQGCQGSHPAQHGAALLLLLSSAAVATGAAPSSSLLLCNYDWSLILQHRKQTFTAGQHAQQTAAVLSTFQVEQQRVHS